MQPLVCTGQLLRGHRESPRGHRAQQAPGSLLLAPGSAPWAPGSPPRAPHIVLVGTGHLKRWAASCWHRAAPSCASGSPPRAPGIPPRAPGSPFLGTGKRTAGIGNPPAGTGHRKHRTASCWHRAASLAPHEGFHKHRFKPNPQPRSGATEPGDHRGAQPTSPERATATQPRTPPGAAAVAGTPREFRASPSPAGSSRCCRSPPGTPSSGRVAARRDDGPRQVRPWGCPSHGTGARDSGPPGLGAAAAPRLPCPPYLAPAPAPAAAAAAVTGRGTGRGFPGAGPSRSRGGRPVTVPSAAHRSTETAANALESAGREGGRAGAAGSSEAGGCGRAGGACEGLRGPHQTLPTSRPFPAPSVTRYPALKIFGTSVPWDGDAAGRFGRPSQASAGTPTRKGVRVEGVGAGRRRWGGYT